MNCLKHHGIFGQRWGIRRFQNEDGSLTPAGRERYLDDAGHVTSAGLQRYNQLNAKYEDEDKEDSNLVTLQKTKAGIVTGSSHDIIKKGSTFQRIADSGEKIDSRRKYVSITQEDNDLYSEYADEGMLGIKNVANSKVFNYKATKDLKVAKGEEVVDYILNTIDDERGTLRDAYKDFNAYKRAEDMAFDMSRDKKVSSKDKQLVSEMSKLYKDAQSKVNSAFQNALFKDKRLSDTIFKHFTELGYDAIIDVEDAMTVADYPLILLNPKNSIVESDN